MEGTALQWGPEQSARRLARGETEAGGARALQSDLLGALRRVERSYPWLAVPTFEQVINSIRVLQEKITPHTAYG